MMRRNGAFFLFVLAAGLPACVAGSGAPPVAVETAPLDVNRVFTDVRMNVTDDGEATYSAALCDPALHRHCKARIPTDSTGHPIGPRAGAAGAGLGPADLQAAYGIDTSKSPGATVAIVDAFGYPGLESDLAKYRSMYGLPPCTTASGCLTIVNQQGQTSPMPAGDGQGCNGWAGETSLDVDMVSAACPNCKILVVLSNDDDNASMMPNLEMSQATAAMLNATVISDSWGGADSDPANIMKMDKYFDVSPHKTGIFIASGDAGWNNAGAGQGMTGPDFPSTSEFVIGVGGTTLKKSTTSARGWTETVWSGGGSSCSPVIATPTWQQGITTSCSFRAAVDVAAVADPATGVNTVCGGSAAPVGGTSAASPFVAAVFALYGHGQNKADFVYNNKSAWYDVTSGSNGTCGNILCNAQAGWDGPTGLGTPNGKVLGTIAPTDGQTPPDMASPPDMATPPDLAGPAGNGGGDGNGGGGGNGNGGGSGTGGNGNNGGNGGGSSGCAFGGNAAAGGLWIFLVLGAAILGRTIRFRR